MPRFSPTGHDMFLCQFCGRDCDSGVETPVWVHGRGNKCEKCVAENVDEFNPMPGLTIVDSATKEVVKSGPIDLKKYNGKVTVKNPASGNHRTFKIHTAREGALKGMRIVSLLVGTSDFIGLGFVKDDGTVSIWKKHKGTQHEKVLAVLIESEKFARDHKFEYLFSVKCRICNKELTDPTSIDLGIGPVCRGEGKVIKATRPLSLAEHCRQESGGLEGQALNSYINRHYGHN